MELAWLQKFRTEELCEFLDVVQLELTLTDDEV